MAIYRAVHLSFWEDIKVVDDFTPEDKLFFLYLLTNPHTTLCGCYPLSVRQAALEIGFSMDEVRDLLSRMEIQFGVINYDHETKEVLICNWSRYNWTTSGKFIIGLKKAIEAVKSENLKEILIRKFNGMYTVLNNSEYRIDTVSKPYLDGADMVGISENSYQKSADSYQLSEISIQHTSTTPSKNPCAHARDEDGTAVVDGGSFEQEIIREEQADAFENVWAAFEKLNINLPASTAGNDIARYLDAGMEPGVLLEVAKASGNANAQSWKYPKAILEKYLKRGILTVQQAMDDSAAFENQKARRKREQEAKAAGTRPADYYDPADYAKDDPDGTAWAEMFESLQAH